MRPHVILLLIICLFSFLPAQEKISGKLTQDTVWKNLVRVDGDVIVPKNVTLTIEPGCRVRMEPKSDKTRSGKAPERIEIIIFGTLIAKGVEGNGRIVFTSRTNDQKMNDWYGIVFKNRNNRSIMQNCLIEYAYKGITCYGSAPMIANSEIRFNQYAGISAEIRSKPIIRNTMISGNEFGGIICELASNPIVEKSIITQNTNGIIVFDQSKPDLGSVRGTDGQSIGENLIFNNFETNIYNHSANDIYAQNNSWNTGNSADIESSLFDGGDNAAKGKVVFLPVGGNAVIRRSAPVAVKKEAEPQPLVVALPEDPKRRSREEAIQSVDRKSASATRRKEETSVANTVKPQVRNTSNNSKLAASSPPPKTNTPASTPPAKKPANTTPAANSVTQPATTPPANVGQPTVAKQETLIVYRDRIVPEKKAATVAIPQEPLIEALLDGGRRQYAKRVKPRYPAIYKKTGNEGKVFMEVVVGKSGKVQNYRIIRSDGDLFSESATEAIKKFEYKPATYKGQPVSFKLVEPFFFKLGK